MTLIDQNDAFTLGFSKLDILFRHQTRDEARLPYRRLVKRGIEFRQETVLSIDPQSRRVGTDKAAYDADFLVVALGADYDLTATPGFVEGGFEYYSIDGAERLRDELPRFRGGKVLLAVLSIPFNWSWPAMRVRSMRSADATSCAWLPLRRSWSAPPVPRDEIGFGNGRRVRPPEREVLASIEQLDDEALVDLSRRTDPLDVRECRSD